MSATETIAAAGDLGDDLSSGARTDDDFQYRPISSSAVASLIFGLLSGLVFLAGKSSLQACLWMCPIPMVGIVLGVRALGQIRSMPEGLSGSKLATVGTLLSTFCLVVGVSYSGYIYATEVPEGYARTSFGEFRPDEIDRRGGLLVPKEIAELDGKQVFIKGFMRADSTPQRHNVRRFLLVRDNNQCCFGDLSKVKYFDQVLVAMSNSVRTDYSTGLFRMGGTLRVHPENARRGPGYPVFTLDADYVQ